MTPAEVAAKLRIFNDWRRGDEDIPQPDPREIGEAIDAAVEMIDRLEAAEKSDAESIAMYRKARARAEEAEAEAIEQARLNGMGSEREAALMAKLEAAERERDDVAQQLVQAELGKRKLDTDCDELRAALEKIADWHGAYGPYPETNEAWRAMAVVTAREIVPQEGVSK